MSFTTYRYELNQLRLDDLLRIKAESGASVSRLIDYAIDRFRWRYASTEDERAGLAAYLAETELRAPGDQP